ncbi:MAG TPA: hypothetical protein VLG13_02755, partial [Patescibacteria group bacterium]|nr:hypothetical protein [Patescibacteria group bacterium]
VFVLPPPTIKQYDTKTKNAVAASANSHFVLSKDGTKLWVNADGLSKLSYPVTIDPSVVVTSTSDFAAGNNDSNIDYPANQINRGNQTGESISGGWATTNNIANNQRYGTVSLAYNGFIYTLGGCLTSDPNCTGGTYYNDVQYSAINSSNGTLGTWAATTSFTNGRGKLGAATYNGYMYILGGRGSSLFSDVQYSLICTGSNNGVGGCGATAGTVGTWTATTSFSTAADGVAAVAYNGFLYLTGGDIGASKTNSVQYAAINGDGTIGAWQSTTGFGTSRSAHSAVVYNGYLYIMGGSSGTSVWTNSVQYASINSDGTVGTWAAGTVLPLSAEGITAVAYNGYLYIYGGASSSGSWTCRTQTYFTQISANGTIGSWEQSTSTDFTTGRRGAGGVAYNGYLYVVGGGMCNIADSPAAEYAKIDPVGTPDSYAQAGLFSAENEDTGAAVYNGYMYAVGRYANGTNTFAGTVQYALINSNGTLGTWTTTNTIPSSIADISAVAYSGFLYAVGGQNSSAILQTTVYYAAIGTSGALSSAWTTTNALPNASNAFGWHNAAVANGYMYVGAPQAFQIEVALVCTSTNSGVGGCSGTPGTVGTWNTYATAHVIASMTEYDGYLYVGYGGGTFDVFYALVCTSSNSGVGGCSGTPGTVGTWTDAGASTSGYNPLFVSRGILYATLTNWNYGMAVIGSSGAPGTIQSIPHPVNANQGGVTVTNGYIYIIGGYNSGTNRESDYAVLNNGGTGMVTATSNWPQTSTNFSTIRGHHTTVAYNGFLYVIGGESSGTPQNDVQYAALDSSGNTGTWNTTTSFSIARSGHTSVIYNGYLYIIGGKEGASNTSCKNTGLGSLYCNDVQYALICTGSNNGVGGCGATAGTVGTWNTTTNFTTPRANHTSVVNNGYVYIIGGWDGAAGNPFTDVQYALICTGSNNGVGGCGATAGTIGTWNTTTSLSTTAAGGRHNFSANVYNGYVYIMGGQTSNGGGELKEVDYALICTGSNNGVGGCGATAGTVGTWIQTASLDIARSEHASVAYNGFIYVLGGLNALDGSYTSINADGSLSKWGDMPYFNVTRYAEGAAVYNGYIYATGGIGYYNGTLYTSLGSILREGLYSKLIDFGSATNKVTSITYNGTLPNGLNAISYADAGSNGVFGAVQSAGSIPGGGGGYSKRYVWVSISFDDTNTGTFPDTTTTSANVTDFTVNYATNSAPASPTLIAPSSGAAHQALQPTFQLRTTDGDNDYLQYKIDVCSDNLCNTILHTIDQSASQTGWSGQNQAGGTAYTGSSVLTSSTIANYAYQFLDLAQGTTYYWRGAGLDPNGTANWGPNSSIQSFTTLGFVSTPTTITPANSSTGASVTPQFQLRSSDASGADYARYKVVMCTNAGMTTGCQTFDQTASQTGWSGQDSQASTAYVTSSTLTSSTIAHYTVQSALSYGTQYYWQAYAIDPGDSNTWSAATSVQTFTTSFQPNAPTLITPMTTGTSIFPLFQLSATDGDGDYLKYKFDLCSTSNCSSIITTIDQTSSQTGWQDQDQSSATGYSSGRIARYQWQGTNLTPNTQYWWRAFAIDPAGTNTFSSASSIGTFTTGQTQSTVRGGSIIKGGTIVQ